MIRPLVALLVGALFAGALFVGLAFLVRFEPRPPSTAAKVHLHSKAVAQAAKARPRTRTKVRFQAPPKVLEAKKEPKKARPVDKLDGGNIVETARPTIEQVPTKTNNLGRYDMKVEREVKARTRRAPGVRDLGKMVLDNPSAIQSPQSTSKAPTQIPQRKQIAKAVASKPSENASTALPTTGPGAAPLAKAGETTRQGSPVVRGSHDGLLLPATSPGNVMHNIQALAGNPGSNDYLPDIEDEGETNLLNTRKFRYWDFFQRVKDKISSEWDPGRVWKSRDPNGTRYGVRDRFTLLRVTLDPDGGLKSAGIARRSGLDFLDEEAQRAFAAAGPFPNPPTGLRNERGDIEFQFGFMFEISTQRFKFYRVNE